MKQTQIILRFLFPSYQDATKPVHPAMRPLHNPAASLEACFTFDCLSFFTSGSNVGCITKLFHQISYFTGIISLIQRHTLWVLLCRFRTLYRNTLYRCRNHLAVMPICSINRQADRHTVGFRQQTSFNAFFSPIRRVWAGFFPRQAGLLSLRRPWTAKTSQYLSIHRSLPEIVPIVSERPRLWSTLENGCGLCYLNKYLFRSERSTDSRFAGQKRFHPWLCDLALEACHHRNDGYLDALATAAQFSPITRLKSCICFLFFVSSSLNPFKGIIAFEYIGRSGVIRIGSKCNCSKPQQQDCRGLGYNNRGRYMCLKKNVISCARTLNIKIIKMLPVT